jgi:hypothetical protein
LLLTWCCRLKTIHRLFVSNEGSLRWYFFSSSETRCCNYAWKIC